MDAQDIPPPAQQGQPQELVSSYDNFEVGNEAEQKPVPQHSLSQERWFVQAGSFSQEANAKSLAKKLAKFGAVEITKIMVQSKEWYRVTVAAQSNKQAEKMLEDIFKLGIKDAKIIHF